MIEFFMTFLVFLFVIVIMAVGVMRGRPPIAGSCGGLGAMGVDGACEICGVIRTSARPLMARARNRSLPMR